jgi:hypothetical protein
MRSGPIAGLGGCAGNPNTASKTMVEAFAICPMRGTC